MLSEINQTEKGKYCLVLLTCGIWKIQQTSEYNKKEVVSQREQTSSYQWGEGSGKGQYRHRGLRGTNF